MVDERRCALMERLRPIMGEDSSIAADILIQALRREFNELVKKEDQVRRSIACPKAALPNRDWHSSATIMKHSMPIGR